MTSIKVRFRWGFGGILFFILAAGVFTGWAEDSKDPQQVFRVATNHLKNQRWGQAEVGFKKVLKSDPENLKAHFYLGEAEYYSHHLAEAEAYFKWVNFHDPDMPVNHYYLGRAAYDQKQYEQALSEMETACRLDPQIAIVHYYLGLIHYKRREIPESQNELQKAESMDAASPKIHYALAYLQFHDLHQSSQALREVRAGLGGNPDRELRAKLLRLEKQTGG